MIVTVAHIHQLDLSGTLDVTAFGIIPLTFALTPSGEVRAYIGICPHQWIVMRRTARVHDCIACPKHRATFDIASGQIRDPARKRIPRGLCTADTTIRDGYVAVDLKASHLAFFVQSIARRIVRGFMRRLRRRR